MMATGKRYASFIKNNLGFLSGFMHLGAIQVSNAVIQLLLFPLIIHVTGLELFGIVMVANTYAALNALFINYGTNQSGIKDVALFKNDRQKLSGVFYTIYASRILLFFLSLILLFVLYKFHFPNVGYFPFALTIIFAEVLNPFFFFVGIEKVYLYNLVNLISKTVSALLIYFLVKTPDLAGWVNFYLGIANIGGYCFLTLFLVKKYGLVFNKISRKTLRNFFKLNFFLVGNNLSVQLQQSIFVFAISFTNNSMILGAYSFCDKIVWSFRLLIIAFTNAIFPKATHIFHTNPGKWRLFRKKITMLLAALFIVAAFGILLLAPWVVHLFTKTNNELAIIYTRAICLVPLIAALNSMNVLDLLLKNKYNYIFFIAMILLAISAIVSFIFIRANNSGLFGYYQIIVEIFSLPLYLYFMHKSDRKTDAF